MSNHVLCWQCRLQRATEHTPLGSHCLSCTLGFLPSTSQTDLDEAERVRAEYEESVRAAGMKQYLNVRDQNEQTANRLCTLYTNDEKAMKSYEEHAAGWNSDLRALVDAKILAHQTAELKLELESLNEDLPALRQDTAVAALNLHRVKKETVELKTRADNLLELVAKSADMRGFKSNKKRWFLDRLRQAIRIEESSGIHTDPKIDTGDDDHG